MARMSLPQMVDARTAITTCPGPGRGSSTSATTTRRSPGRYAPRTSTRRPRGSPACAAFEQGPLDRIQGAGAELLRRGTDPAIDLVRVAGADDRAVDAGPRQRPGHCEL